MGARSTAILTASASLFFSLLLTTTAATFKVNSVGNEEDTNPGDGRCVTSRNTCTLRAAIEESNKNPSRDTIDLPAGFYKTYGTGSKGGLSIHESVTIRGAGAASTTLSGGKKERHFKIVNEKLIFGLPGGEIGAFRPYSGKRLRSVGAAGEVKWIAGAFLFTSDAMYVTQFIDGVAKFNLRSRETIENSGNKFPYTFDRFVVDADNGNGAGLTTPTAIAQTADGDLLVNSFQPTLHGIRRYDLNTFEYKGIFIDTPGIVDSMVKVKQNLYLTLVGLDEVRMYDAKDGKLVTKTSQFLRTPRGITECNGRIFVASEDTNSVVEFNTDLKKVDIFSSPLMKEPIRVACLDRELFVKVEGSQILHYRLRDGEFGGVDLVRQLSVPGKNIGGLAMMKNRDHIDGPKVNILDVTMRDGRVETGDFGPSLSIYGGTNVKVDRCVIRNNNGSIYGGAVVNFGTTVIQNSRLVENSGPTWSLSGGGVTNSGGAIGNIGKMTLRWSELSDNVAARGGAIWNTGSEGYLVVFQCTISNNYAGNAGGGIYNTRYAQVKFSTITQNRCGQFSGDPAHRRAGCGIYSSRDPKKKLREFHISHTIVAQNVQMGNRGVYAPDCLASADQSVVSAGGNIIGGISTDSCKIIGRLSLDERGEHFNEIDAQLGRLSFLRVPDGNGRFKRSFTRGHNPVANGPAHTFNPFMNGITPSDACPAKDQVGRARSQGVACDIGSIERME